MSAQSRLNAVAGQLASSPKGILAGQVAIVTGVRPASLSPRALARSLARTDSHPQQAAQGIGRSCAILFAQEGAKVVVSDLDEGASSLAFSCTESLSLTLAYTQARPSSSSTRSRRRAARRSRSAAT